MPSGVDSLYFREATAAKSAAYGPLRYTASTTAMPKSGDRSEQLTRELSILGIVLLSASMALLALLPESGIGALLTLEVWLAAIAGGFAAVLLLLLSSLWLMLFAVWAIRLFSR